MRGLRRLAATVDAVLRGPYGCAALVARRPPSTRCCALDGHAAFVARRATANDVPRAPDGRAAFVA
ncbi:hypothetical protein [Streptomyces tendae]